MQIGRGPDHRFIMTCESRVRPLLAPRWRFILLLPLLVVCRPSSDAFPQQRLVRHFAAEDGLIPTWILSLAQDTSGFIWIGTSGGLFRYDGVEMRRWAPAVLNNIVALITQSRQGRMVVFQEPGDLFEVTADGARPIPIPEERGASPARYVAFGGDDRLWAIFGDAVAYREPSGVWVELPREVLAGERPRRLWGNLEGGVDIATAGGLWTAGAAAGARKLASVRGMVDLEHFPDGRRLAITSIPGRVFELDDQGASELFSIDARGIAVLKRGETIWAAFSRYLVAIREEGTEVLGLEDGIDSGGQLLVDHEGSLWLGTWTGLFQYPEPETATWSELEGLPSAHARFVVRTGDTLWVTTWQGAGLLRRDRSGLWSAATIEEWRSISRIFADSRGVLWVGTDTHILEIRRGRIIRRHPIPGYLYAFSEDPAGGLWIGEARGLLRAEFDDHTLRRVSGLPFGDGARVHAVLHDRSGQLWAASAEQICQAAAIEVRAGSPDAWSCQVLPGIRRLTALLETPSGQLWAGTELAGVLRFRSGRWEPLPGNDDLPSRHVHHMAPSPAGGVWLQVNGAALRVGERPDAPAGWELLERLSGWQGLTTTGGGYLLEEEDGTLWITSARGVTRVPAAARYASTPPPRVALVEARIDDERISLEAALALPRARNRLELRFAALSFRDPSLVRYQVRVSPEDPWSDLKASPVVRWVDLPPGRYRAEVRASLDGVNWSPAPRGFAFRVLPPWYLHPLALTLFVLAGTFLIWCVYRARIAYLLGLERQRTMIAMDLHDEMGSGLGSIGILSGLLASDNVRDGKRERLARDIAETAEGLGGALSDIIWSLDGGTRSLQELAGRLAEHGHRLFSDDGVEFTTRFPDSWPTTSLSLPVRRNVLLVGLEALHNAARHSQARHVTLGLERRGAAWELSVTDDGTGLHEDASENVNGHGGMGLSSMRRRAEEIGGELVVTSAPEAGTTVTFSFTLGPRVGGERRSLVRRLWPRAASDRTA